MKTFDYSLTIEEPFKSIEAEVRYLTLMGQNGWELVTKDTIGIKKKTAIIQTGPEESVKVYNKFYWKREHDDNGESRQGNSEGPGEGQVD